jgi:cation transport ATPase
MTCAACAVRVEKKLGKLDGVHAMVNYATATALVTAPADLPVQALTAAVDQAGYTATARAEQFGADEDGAADEHGADRDFAYLRRRLIVALIFPAPRPADRGQRGDRQGRRRAGRHRRGDRRDAARR